MTKAQFMYLPKPIYEAIPYIYLGSAVATIVALTPPISIFSGILFAYAGWMVWRTRKDFRRYNPTEKRTF